MEATDTVLVGWADSKARFKIEQRQRRIGTERGKVATAGALAESEELMGFLSYILYCIVSV